METTWEATTVKPQWEAAERPQGDHRETTGTNVDHRQRIPQGDHRKSTGRGDHRGDHRQITGAGDHRERRPQRDHKGRIPQGDHGETTGRSQG